MADTLLFRGGSSADIATSTVQSREIVIDTDTDQIVSGTSKKKTVMEDSSGNIAMDGSATFGAGSRLELIPDTGLRGYRSNFYIGGLDYSTNDLTIESAFGGNILFKAQTLNTGSSPGTAAERMRLNGEGNLFIGGTLPSAANIELNANGKITAAGTVTAAVLVADSALTSAVVQLKQTNGIYNLESTAGDFRIYRAGGGSPGEKFRVTNSGDVKIGGTLPSAPDITLNANGSATFAGKVISGSDSSGSVAAGVVLEATGKVTASRSGGGSEVFRGKEASSNNPTSQIFANGSAEFAGDVTCSDNSKGLVLKSPDGTSFRLSVANDGTLSATSI